MSGTVLVNGGDGLSGGGTISISAGYPPLNHHFDWT
jgi:hypothetical protein